MACVGASLLEDKKSVFVGTGLPVIAAMLAQKTHAPNLLIVFEAGGISPMLPEIPVSVGDSRTFHRGIMATSMHDVMAFSQSGYLDYGLLGSAQIDIYGNINTTAIGDYSRPMVRLPGSGGANDVGSFAQKLIIMAAKQSKKTFVSKLDCLTTPGYLDGPGSREMEGLPAGSGPYRVVTQIGVYGFDSVSKKMTVLSIHPGGNIETVKDNCGFDIIIPEHIEETPLPSPEYLQILREEIDPAGIFLGKD